MKRVFFLPAVALAVAVSGHAENSTCQYKDWMGRAEEVEGLLSTAEIVTVEDVGMGVTKPSRVDLKSGEEAFGAAFKPIKRGRHGGFWESYEAEVAAYVLDKLLGLGMVPPTVKRKVEKRNGSLQYWVEDCHLYRDVMSKTPATAEWSHQLSRMKMFDVLINNEDRNAQNFLVDPDFHIILIDHSRAFITSKKMLKNKKKLPNQYDRELMERLRALDKETLEAHLKPILMGGQVKGVWQRREFLLEHMEKLIEEKGEARTLF